jgi:hypothetical protein
MARTAAAAARRPRGARGAARRTSSRLRTQRWRAKLACPRAAVACTMAARAAARCRPPLAPRECPVARALGAVVMPSPSPCTAGTTGSTTRMAAAAAAGSGAGAAASTASQRAPPPALRTARARRAAAAPPTSTRLRALRCLRARSWAAARLGKTAQTATLRSLRAAWVVRCAAWALTALGAAPTACPAPCAACCALREVRHQ